VPLRLRLIGLVSVLVLIVAGAAAAVTTALRHVESNRERVSASLRPAGVQSRNLLVSLVDQETGERGFLLTGDDAFLEPYRDGGARLTASVADLRRDFAGDAGMTTAIDRVAEAAATWRRVGATPEIALRRSGDVQRAQALVATGRGKGAFDEVRRRVASLQTLIDARTRAAQTEDADDLRLLRNVILVSRGLMIVILVFSGFLLRRWILLPILQLRARMRAVAGGDIEEQVLIDGPPEVAAIGRDAESMRRRIVEELEDARAATEALTQHSPVVSLLSSELTSHPLADADGLEISGMVLSAEGVLAGDWWEAVRRPDGSTALVLADVSGHGAEAGLVAFAFKQRITTLLDTELDLATAFELAARHRDADNERFLSCLVVVIDPDGQRLSWINAGHPPALVFDRQDRAAFVELGPTGPLISSVTSGWEVASTLFGPDDLLIACTDGVLEARDLDGRELGTTGLLDVVRRLDRWTADEAVAECREAVRRFAVDVRRDDVTCVALTLAPRPQRAGRS
jgi:serine phosphatase RsbU (regulator of sigma subunit)/CHASE3 domain sensor protein